MLNFQNSSKINKIIYIIKNELDTIYNPGNCLNIVYQLLFGIRIIDGFITNKFEIELTLSFISKLENSSIDLIVIGVAIYPKNN